AFQARLALVLTGRKTWTKYPIATPAATANGKVSPGRLSAPKRRGGKCSAPSARPTHSHSGWATLGNEMPPATARCSSSAATTVPRAEAIARRVHGTALNRANAGNQRTRRPHATSARVSTSCVEGEERGNRSSSAD